MENAWICLSLCVEEAQYCKREMHFVRTCGNGFSGVVEKKLVNVKEQNWFLGTCNMGSFEDRFICLSHSLKPGKWHNSKIGCN